MKYLRSTTLVYNDLEIRKSEFVAKTQFLYLTRGLLDDLTSPGKKSSSLEYHWVPQIFIGDPKLFIGDPRFSLDPKLIIRNPKLFIRDSKLFMSSWIFSGDHKFIIKDPQIFIADHKSFSSETLRISLDTLSFSLEIPSSSVEDICIGYPMRSDINLGVSN